MAGIYFFDDFALDRKIGVENRYFSPEIFSREPFCDPRGAGYSSMHWCPEIEKYRLWYGRLADIVHDEQDVALAESDDARSWTPIELRMGNSGSLRVDKYFHGPSVYRDPYEKNPERLYKLAGVAYTPSDRSPYDQDGIIATSPDGIRWDINDKRMQWGHTKSDTYNNIIYNPVRAVYQVFHRASLTDRRIHLTYSKDLVEWSEPELVIQPDPFDPPCCQHYGMSASYLDGLFIGFLYIYHTDMFDPVSYKMCGYVVPELVYSYDGFHWIRTHRRVFDYPPLSAYGAGSMYTGNITLNQAADTWLMPTASCLLPHGDVRTKNGEVLIFGTDAFMQKAPTADFDYTTDAILTHKIRPHGFVGLYGYGTAPSKDTGNLLLKPIDLLSDDLCFNINAANGLVQFQVCDFGAKPMPGFTFQENIPMKREDAIRYRPRWKEHAMPELVNKRIRIEIKLHNALLYSIQGSFRPHHAAVAQIAYGNPKMIAPG